MGYGYTAKNTFWATCARPHKSLEPTTAVGEQLKQDSLLGTTFSKQIVHISGFWITLEKLGWNPSSSLLGRWPSDPKYPVCIPSAVRQCRETCRISIA